MYNKEIQKIINRELEDVKKYLSEGVGDYLSEDVKKYLSEDYKRYISDHIDDTTDKYIDVHHQIARIRNEEEKRLLKHAETIFNTAIKEVREKLKNRDYYFLSSRLSESYRLFFTDDFWGELELKLGDDGSNILRTIRWDFRYILLEERIIVTESTKGEPGLHFLRIDSEAVFLIKTILRLKKGLFD